MRIIYFLTFITLILTSCEVDKINSDDDLIESIINFDEKIVVLETELPIDSKVFIDEELPEEFIDRSLLANDLGFEIEMRNLDYKDLGLKKENIYFDRFTHIMELNRLGCNIKLEDSIAIIEGDKSLVGANVMSTDIRASAALIIAALCAKGVTKISRVYHIDRGYDKIEKKLTTIGAEIFRKK